MKKKKELTDTQKQILASKLERKNKKKTNKKKELTDTQKQILLSEGKKKKGKKKGCLVAFGIVFIIIVAVIAGALVSKEEKESTKTENQIQKGTKGIQIETEEPSSIAKTEGEVTIPRHIILKEDVFDSPIKTQVTLEALVSGEISAPGLKILLDQLYSSIKAKKGFKYHDSPTNIYIYTYTSKERAESGMGQWIAMLQKTDAETSPTISINERQIAQLGAEPEERFGLSEEKRKGIWKEIILIEDRAMEEAIKRYPKELEEQIEMERRLIDEHKSRLGEENGLTHEEIRKISLEGIEKDWTFPKMS